MKTFYNQLFLVPVIMLGIIFGAQFSVQGQGSNLGFTVENISRTYDGTKTIIVWKVTQTTSQTGLSHFVVQNFCLPSTSSIIAENSSDGSTWNSINTTTDDGSTKGCQDFGSLLKLSGATNSKTNFYRLTLNGNYTLVPGKSIIKVGNGQGRTNDESCEVIDVDVPVQSSEVVSSKKEICAGGTTSFQASNSEGTSYKWYYNGVLISGVNSSSITNKNEAGIYKVTYTVGTCTYATEEFELIVNALPDVTLTSSTICADGSVDLTTKTTQSGGTWSGTGVSGTNFCYATAGDYTLTYSYTNSNNCTTTKTTTVTVNALPDVTLTSSTICADGSVDLTTKTTQSGGTWSGTGVSGTNFCYATAGDYTLTYSYTNSNNCTTTKTTTVTVNALPDFTLTASTICADGSVDLTTKTTQSGGTWSGTGVSGTNFSYATAGDYTLTYSYTNSNNCTTTKTTTVTVNALPDFTLTASTICADGSVDLTTKTTQSGGTWSGTAVSGTNFSYATAGEYTLTYSYTNSNNCTTTKTTTVTVNALPDFTLTASTICADGSVDLTTKTTQSGGTWSGTGVSGTNFSYATAGEYTLSYSYTNGSGCTTTKTTTVTVNALPTVSISGTTTICAGTSTTLSASGADSYFWTPGGAGSSITVSPTTNTTYKVVGTTNGCTGSAEVEVVVNPKPSISLSADKTSVCAGNKVVLTATNIAGATYDWGSASSSTGNSIEVSPSANSTYSVKASVNGCISDEKSITISVTECIKYYTYTQGFYGNVGGKTCEGSSTSSLFTKALPSGSMVFGKSGRIFTLTAKDLTDGSIYKLLPGGGTPTALKEGSWTSSLKGGNSPIDSKGKINNNLLSQTITLWFNIRTSDNNLGGYVLPNSFTTAKVNCGDKSINMNDQKTFNVTNALAGKSVDQLFELANKALGNGLVSGDPSLNDIYTTIDLINNAFDQGRAVVNSARNNSTTVIKTNNINTMSISAAIPRPQVDVINAYPNPFTDKLSIVITAKASGHASLAIYDASGLKVADMFDGELSLGEERTFEFFAPSGRGVQTYIYHFVQGDQVIQGKLLSL